MRNDHLSSSFHWYRKIIHSHLFWVWKISFYISTKDHPLYWGAKAKRNLFSSYKRSNAWCWKANVRWVKFQNNVLSSSYWKNINEQKQSKTKMLKRKLKKNVEEKWIEKKPRGKNGLKWKCRETKKEDQSRIGPSCDEKCSLV